MKKAQQILTLVLSLGFIAVFAALFWILPDADESTVERRHLAKSPTLSFSSVANGSFMNSFEKYMLDQFPLRDGFRTVSYTHLSICIFPFAYRSALVMILVNARRS